MSEIPVWFKMVMIFVLVSGFSYILFNLGEVIRKSGNIFVEAENTIRNANMITEDIYYMISRVKSVFESAESMISSNRFISKLKKKK